MHASHASRLQLVSGTYLNGHSVAGLHEDPEFHEAVTGIPGTTAKFTDFSANHYIGDSYTHSLAGTSKADHDSSEDGGDSSDNRRTFQFATNGIWSGESLLSRILKNLGVYISSAHLMRELQASVEESLARKNIVLDNHMADAISQVMAEEGIVLDNLNINQENAHQAADIVQNAIMESRPDLFRNSNVEDCNTPESMSTRCDGQGFDPDTARIMGYVFIEDQLSLRTTIAAPAPRGLSQGPN